MPQTLKSGVYRSCHTSYNAIVRFSKMSPLFESILMTSLCVQMALDES